MGQNSDTISIDFSKNGSISFALFKPSSTRQSGNSISFLKSIIANNNSATDFVLVKTKTDQLGIVHQNFQQTFNGVNVYNGNYSVHSINGIIDAIKGKYYSISLSSTTPVLTETDALNNAMNYIGATTYAWQDSSLQAFYKSRMNNLNANLFPTGKLIAVSKEITSTEDKLCWIFNITSKEPFDEITILIDAANGNLIQKNSNICNGTPNAYTKYYGMQHIDTKNISGLYILDELRTTTATGNYARIHTLNNQNNSATPPISQIEFTNNTNIWDNNWQPFHVDQTALDAHWGMENVMDYFSTVHQRNSYDDNGGDVLTYMHWDLNKNTAFWNPNFKFIGLGDGDGKKFNPLTDIETCGHEFGHGLYQAATNWTTHTSVENDALNEGLSDIWGICVKNWSLQTTPINWEIGDKMMINAPNLRSLSNPKRWVRFSITRLLCQPNMV